MRKLPLAAAAITLMMTTTVLTSCTDDNDNPVVITDDKPFTYNSEIDETVRPGDDSLSRDSVASNWMSRSKSSSFPTLNSGRLNMNAQSKLRKICMTGKIPTRSTTSASMA